LNFSRAGHIIGASEGVQRRGEDVLRRLLLSFVLAATVALGATAAASATSFTNTVLRAPFTLPPGFSSSPANQSGDSEPAIDFGGPGHTMAVDGLGWLPFAVNLWKGHFGDTPPAFFGAMDTLLPIQGSGRTNLGDGDADVEVTSTGTILLADLDIIFSGGPSNNVQLGVSVTRCPATATGPTGCHSVLLDTTGADRPWVTTRGTEAWVSYHNSGNSAVITVWHSTDDGQTWTKVHAAMTGQDQVTAGSTFNNLHGPIVADPTSSYIYQPFASGEPQTKCCSASFNNIYVARSADGGLNWTIAKVFHAPPFTRLNNFFPALGVDETTGKVWVAWTDQHGVSVSSSTDHGATWSMPLTVSTATTTVMPWVAARGGKVDVVYYGSSAASTDDPNGVWNTYDSQFTSGTWNVIKVSNTPNRLGRVCLEGFACAGNVDRELLDLFEVAEDPVTNRAAVIYTDTTLDTWTSPVDGTHQLPEIVLAYEQP
jgi:hypothetical protein